MEEGLCMGSAGDGGLLYRFVRCSHCRYKLLIQNMSLKVFRLAIYIVTSTHNATRYIRCVVNKCGTVHDWRSG